MRFALNCNFERFVLFMVVHILFLREEYIAIGGSSKYGYPQLLLLLLCYHYRNTIMIIIPTITTTTTTTTTTAATTSTPSRSAGTKYTFRPAYHDYENAITTTTTTTTTTSTTTPQIVYLILSIY